MATSSSVIVLDSDSDDDGVIIESPSSRRGSKRKASPSTPTTTSHIGTQQNGTNSGASGGARNSASSVSGGGAHDPQRKRIKPITIATNLSDKRWSPDGKTSPHNNNNNNHTITGNENFAPITYSEDWEQEIKQYQQKLAGGGDNRDPTLPATAATVTRCRSSTTNTTTNDDSDPNSSNRGTPGPVEVQPSKNEQAAARRQSRKAAKCTTEIEKNPIGKEFQELLDACRQADGSNEMELLIKQKLIRYYEIVHPDYVKSKSFKKAVTAATAGIRAQPRLVYLKLVNIVEELKARRKSRSVATSVETVAEAEQDNPSTGGHAALAEEDFSTGNAKKDLQIRQLNYALYVLNKRIHLMEQAEVDFSEEANSSYVKAERCKKHAYKIYEKLCDITGESKNAHRLVRKPVNFQDTSYPEFNHTLSQFLGRTNIFPNFRDVLRCLEHCNTRYGYGLRSERMNRIAHDAFIKVGKLLQKRRKTDLYETVMYYTGYEKDPATSDPKLREKLEENGKHYSKVNSIIDKYAEKELSIREGNHEKKDKSATSAKQSNETMPSSSKDSAATTATSTDTGLNGETHNEVLQLSDDDDEDDDDDDESDEEEDEEEEDDAESTTKENVRPDSFEDVVISDDEELIILDS